MTEQEKQLIEGLASRIHNAPAPEIDREADAAIRNGIGSRPDALYILTQTVLVQEMALSQAKAQMDDLKKQAQGAGVATGASSFLGGHAASQSAPAALGQPSWWHRGSQQPAAAMAPPPLPSAPPAGGGMFSGFLKTAATAAAGVVAGEVAFSALSGLFGQHSGGGMMGGAGSGFLGGAAGVSPGSETIINNYYRDPATGDAAADASGGSGDDPASYDAEDDSVAPADSADDSADDSGSYDDGGGDSSDV